MTSSMKVMIMQMKIKFFVFISLIILSKLTISGTIINDDLKESLEKLYETNPELSYERELLKSKDELMPQALSEFRPKISGYYKKGKVDTNSQGFRIVLLFLALLLINRALMNCVTLCYFILGNFIKAIHLTPTIG